MSEEKENLFDLHIHTRCSHDCLTPPKEIVEAAIRRKLSGIAITDHNSVECIQKAKEESQGRLTIVPGQEVKTDHGDILALFTQEEVGSRDVHEVIDEIRTQGGLVIVPHPFNWLSRRIRPLLEEREFLERVDAIETFNARCLLPSFNRQAKQLAKRLNKPQVGGSDAHTSAEVGAAYTILPSLDLEEVKHAILLGLTRVEGSLTFPLRRLSTLIARMRKKAF